jgi:hypothetical protein
MWHSKTCTKCLGLWNEKCRVVWRQNVSTFQSVRIPVCDIWFLVFIQFLPCCTQSFWCVQHVKRRSWNWMLRAVVNGRVTCSQMGKSSCSFLEFSCPSVDFPFHDTSRCVVSFRLGLIYLLGNRRVCLPGLDICYAGRDDWMVHLTGRGLFQVT